MKKFIALILIVITKMLFVFMQKIYEKNSRTWRFYYYESIHDNMCYQFVTFYKIKR